MKMRTFYKELPLFFKKTQFCLLVKNSNLKYELYQNLIFGTFIDPCLASRPSRGVSAAQPQYEQLRGRGEIIASATHILKYICFSDNQFLIQILSCAAL